MLLFYHKSHFGLVQVSYLVSRFVMRLYCSEDYILENHYPKLSNNKNTTTLSFIKK